MVSGSCRGPAGEVRRIGGLYGPGPAAPAPLSKSARTRGVCLANSALAVATLGGLREPERRQWCLLEMPEANAANLSRTRGQGIRLGRHFVGHIDVEELQPPADGLGVGRVDVVAVDHVGEHRCRLRKGIDQRRPLRTGLLVLEGTREEDGHRDVTGPLDHGAAVEEGRRRGPVRRPARPTVGPTRWTRPSDWSWRAWLARQVDGSLRLAASSASIS